MKQFPFTTLGVIKSLVFANRVCEKWCVVTVLISIELIEDEHILMFGHLYFFFCLSFVYLCLLDTN